MSLTRLMVKQFRNITDCDLELSSGFNFLIGPNGSGKTSLLEAIYVLGHGRSFRSALTGRVIQQGESELIVHAKIQDHPLLDESVNQSFYLAKQDLPVGIKKQRDGQTEVKIGGQSGQKIAQLAQVLPLQLIHTEGFELLTEGPKFRRAFIDWGVFHTSAGFYDAWNRFRRLMKQRNALLKTASSYQELSYWDLELAQLAEKISNWRQQYIETLTPLILKIAADFLPEFEIQIQSYQGWTKDVPYLDILKKNFERDKQLGFTFSGPNKADLKLKINATPIEDVLSRGQLKLMVCALRLAQGQHFYQHTSKQCIYLIDDFASELDIQRRQRLSDYLLQTQAQVFISAISIDHIDLMKCENSKMFHVEHGKIAQG